jgi:NitT/TauT family transport system permease protein
VHAEGLAVTSDRPEPVTTAMPSNPKHGRRLKIWAIRLAGILIILGSWELCARQKWIDPLFCGQPTKIVKQIGTVVKTDAFWTNLWVTVQETLAAFVIGAGAGIFVGFLFVLFPLLEPAARPLLVATNAMPRIALAPLFVEWFGLGQEARVALGVSLVFFIVLANTYTGLSTTERSLLLLARTLGYRGWHRLTTFVIPGAIPVIFTGLELGLIYSMLGVVAGEFIGGTDGIGTILQYNANTLQTDAFFAVLTMLVLVATFMQQILAVLERWLLRWHVVEMRGTR